MKLGVIKHHLKTFYTFIKFSYIKQMTYRFNFWFGYLIDISWLAFMFVFFKIFYLNVTDIAGWNYWHILVLLGTYQVYTAFIYGIVIIFNMRNIPKIIWNGELDMFLLKPINSQFHVSAREIWFPQFLNLIPSILLIYMGFQGGGISFNLINLVFYLIAVFSGILIVYAIWFMITCLTFFLEKAEDLPYVPQSFIDYIIEFPIDLFKGRGGFILTWIIPLAFAASFPARILMGSLSKIYAVYGVILAIIFIYLSNKFWKFCLKHYSSASS
ncbi:ABC transporter permease [Patescibacteria group bacterium]